MEEGVLILTEITPMTSVWVNACSGTYDKDTKTMVFFLLLFTQKHLLDYSFNSQRKNPSSNLSREMF